MAESKVTSRKVLLVENEEEAKFIRGLFEKDDFPWDICWAPTLKEAAEWLRRNKGDRAPLVIADYSLPDGPGLDLAGGVKTPDEMDFPLVILLGDGNEEKAIEALKSGALDCVTKGEKEIEDLPRVAKDVLHEWDYITERREAKELFTALADSSQIGIYIVQERRIRFANLFLQRLSGFSEEELLNMDSLMLVHPEDREKVRKNAIKMLKGERSAPYEFRIVTKDGRIKWVLESVTSIRHQGKRAVLGNFMDITERKEMEGRLKETVEKLRKSQEELSTPVVQIWDRILALPLIGIIDSLRAQDIMEVLLNRIVETGSEIVIIDITGVSSVDTEVANHLIKTVQAATLLGTECVLTGIKPEVAQTMIQLGLNMGEVPTRRNMQEGLLYGLKKLGYEVQKERGAQ